MKAIGLMICILCWYSSSGQQLMNADSIIGRWESTRKNLIVDVYKEGNTYKGKIVWFKNPYGTAKPSDTWLDEKNPNTSLRNRKILGMNVMDNLVYNEKSHRWEKGDIYDSTTGKIWSSSAWLTDTGLLKVRGFWQIELLGQTLIFKRV